MMRIRMICRVMVVALLFVFTVFIVADTSEKKQSAPASAERVDRQTANPARNLEPAQTVEPATEIEFPVSHAPAAYEIPWQSINGGGEDIQSTNYQISSSVGQSVTGYATSDNYQAGIGYWYGTGGDGCDCGAWGDVTGDGAINPQDVTFIQQHVFFTNDMRVQYANCPNEAGDVNCDGQVNPQDVTFMVQYVFFTNDMFCADPCGQ